MSGLYVLRRELRALMLAPQTYAIGAAYLVISGVFFVNMLISSQIPDLEHYYANVANTLLVLIPVVAMRAFAEERRSGALDITLAWRMSRAGLVVGKFAANTLYLWVLSSVVWLYYRLIGDMAQIQWGRTAGGYVGLLLMAMAFSALALMVSARASSPAAAAFLGFGLLLFLWILEYAPGWMGGWLASLGPTQHFASFARGVIYWDDVGYFVLATLIGLGLAVVALERDHPGRRLGSGLRRGAALAAVLVFWGGTAALAGDIKGQWDLNSERLQSTTEVTRDTISKVNKLGGQIRVTGFADPLSRETAQLQALVKEFRAAGAQISLRTVDPDAQPGQAAQAGISGYGDALVEMGGRHEVLGDATQGSLTNLLLRLARPTKPQICFTADHGERDFADESKAGLSTLAAQLRYLAYEIKPLSLAAAGAEAALEHCAAVVVAGAQVPLLGAEADFLAAYARHQGRLLVLADATAAGPQDQLNDLLAPWGMRLGSRIVRDASALADDPSSVVAHDYGTGGSPPVLRLHEQNIPVVLTNPVAVDAAPAALEQGAFIELVRSSPKSWIGEAGGGVDRRGPFVLASVADWSRIQGSDDPDHQGAPPSPRNVARTRIGVVGSVEVATNEMINTLGNRDFVTKLVQWIAQDDDLLTAGRPPLSLAKIVFTADQKDRLIRQGIVLPVLAFLIPLPFAALRLRRG